MLLSGGDDLVIRLLLLEHEVHSQHVVSGMAPVPAGVQVSQVEFVLKSKGDPGHSPA